MSERMIPLFDRVLLRRKPMTQSSGGILIPKEVQKREASLRCTVLEFGPDCALRDKLERGDEVLISRYGGDWLNKDGKPITDADEAEFYLVKEVDLLCVFKEVTENDRADGVAKPFDGAQDRFNRAIDVENARLRAAG